MSKGEKVLLGIACLIWIWLAVAGVYNLITKSSERCEIRATPVDHAEEYMDIDVDKYDRITYERRNGERFEAIIYEVCE